MPQRTVSFAAVIFVVVVASSLSILSTDLYAPSLPHLPGYFRTTPELVKLTLSLNLLAFGLAQLVHGPLSDRYGRRRVMLSGMVAFAVFSLACALSQNIGQLIAARILQGVAIAVEAVIGLALIQDVFEERDRVRALALWGMAIALAPAVGPVIGGYVHVWLGWQANFYALAGLAAVTTILIWRVLPESNKPDHDALRPSEIVRGYAALMVSRPYMKYVLIEGALLASIFAFITAAPFLLITQFGVPTERYGLYQGAILVAYIAGALIAERLASTVAPLSLLRAGTVPAVAGALAFPVLAYGGLDSPLSLTAAMSVLLFGAGLMFAVLPTFAMSAAPSRIGSAAAMLGAVEMIVAGLASAAVSVAHDGTSRPLGLTMAGLVLFGVAAHWLAPHSGSAQQTQRALAESADAETNG